MGMFVEELDEIDNAARRNDGTLVPVITDHLSWCDGEHLLLPDEKLNSFLAFVETGQYLEFEQAEKGMPVAIQISAQYPPDTEAREFFIKAGKILGWVGIARASRTENRAGERE